jgi:hypothetical protein
MHRTMKTPAAATLGLLASASASANPRALPFTYTTDTLAKGGVDIEQYVDLTLLRAFGSGSTGVEWYVPSAFQTEIEIGLADRLELGLYMTFVPDPGEQFASKALFSGDRQRPRAVWIALRPLDDRLRPVDSRR